jgi:hypothetical protein
MTDREGATAASVDAIQLERITSSNSAFYLQNTRQLCCK